MSLNNIFRTSSQGMTAQRERLETAAANLANSDSTRTTAGGAYRRRDTILEAVDLTPRPANFGSLFDDEAAQTKGVRATVVEAAADTGLRRYQPDHPDADAAGYVTLPDVDPLEETVNMLSAARAFEANATAFNAAKEMARTSLKLADA